VDDVTRRRRAINPVCENRPQPPVDSTGHGCRPAGVGHHRGKRGTNAMGQVRRGTISRACTRHPRGITSRPHDTVLVLGSSGTLGGVYTFLPPHLWYASEVECCKPTQIDLCTVDGTVRIHPVAAQFPLGSTQYCSELVLHGTAKVISSELISGKDVSVALDSPCGPKLPSDGLGHQ
jgi:hypothetical protein